MSGSGGIGVTSVARYDSPSLSAADNQNISSVLVGSAWNATEITFSFPTSSSVYGTQSTYFDPAPFNGFRTLTEQQKGEVLRAFSLISSYTGLTFAEITETTDTHAAIRLANSSSPPTAYAYYPGTNVQGGDVFYGGTGRFPVMGNFDSGQATLHEIGHALGLKHGQDNFAYGVMNADRLDIEFSLMNYPNYIGSAEGYATASTSAQTYMMYDIAALQYMYGANFNQAGRASRYTWSSSTGVEFIDGDSQGTPVDNHIFETIWTAGATSTYDLSNFSQDQVDDMNPGGWMLFSTAQLADLNAYAPSKPVGEIYARGNIYNALLYNGDTRSLITNIITGSGDDTITGNASDNEVHGGAGNDTISGGIGNDRLYGDAGDDTLIGDSGNDLLDGGAGTDVLTGGTGSDIFFDAAGYGADTVTDFSHADGDRIDFTFIAGIESFFDIISRAVQVVVDTVIDFGNGDRLTLRNVDKAALVASDFVLPTVVTEVIENFGSTSLVQVGNNYFMDPVGGSSGPQLMYGGTPVVAGQFGAWTPIGAEEAAGGYVVAWKNGASDEYTVWNTDTNGSYLWNAIGAVSGSDYGLESLEPMFQQDLNSDGQIGPTTTTIEAFGSTRLDQVANEFFLHDSGGNGPSLKFQGAAVVSGQFGAWTPIGAEAAAGGYVLAWKNGAADEYTVWNTDTNGNYLWNAIGAVPGSDYGLESLEPKFQQDLNSDGQIGPQTTIEAFGSTRLDQVANEFFLHDSGGNGPSLKFQGVAVVPGQFGAWTPIGAEEVAGGYVLAWKNGAADEYTVWNTDSNGNYLWNAIGAVSGSDADLESLEPSFQQDLNGDGTVGLTEVVAANGPTNAFGSGNLGSLDLALLTNYLASTFVHPSGISTSTPVDAQALDYKFLATPNA
jgi:serralysin